MILGALNDYYYRLVERGEEGISPYGYSMEKISYAICAGCRWCGGRCERYPRSLGEEAGGEAAFGTSILQASGCDSKTVLSVG